MKRMSLTVTIFLVALAFGITVAFAQYAVCPTAKIGGPVEKSLAAAFCNYQTYTVDKKAVHLDKAQKQLEGVLKKEPNNPVALNNLAAIMVDRGKLDKADTLLKKALASVKAKPCLVRLNRVCAVNNVCVAIEPVSIGKGNQDMEPMIKMNLEMVKDMMARLQRPKAK